MANLAAMVEAERRGILPENKKALLDEARRRGLVEGPEAQAAQPSFWETVKAKLSPTIEGLPNAALTMLPAAGAGAGAMLSGATGPFAPLVAAGGATVGGAAGKSLENFLRQVTGVGKPGDPILSPLETGGQMGAMEAGAGYLMNPAAAKEGAGKLIDFAKKFELPFSPSALKPGALNTGIESFVNLFPSGKAITTKYQAQLYNKFLETRGQVLAEMTGTQEYMAGKTLQEGIRDTRVGMREATVEAYSGIVPAAGGKDVIIATPKTREFLDGILESPRVQKNPELVKYLESNFGKTTTGMTAKQLDSFQRNIWTRTGKDRELGRDIWTALEADVKAFDESAGKKLYDSIKEARTLGRAQYDYRDVSGLFQKASTIRNGEELFQPDKFYSLVMNERNQATIKRAYGSDALQNMIDYAEFARKAAMESSKRKMSEMGKIFQGSGMLAGGGGIGTALYHGDVGTAALIALPYGTSAVMAHMIMKPRSTFKKWLTKGFSVSEGTRESLKVGGRVAIAAGNEE